MTAFLSAHLMPLLLVLLLQSTGLLLLGLLGLRLTRRYGPAVQSLVGRASLASVALLVLLLPLTGHVPPVVRISPPAPILGSRSLEPIPPVAAPLSLREGAEVGAAGAETKGAETKGTASSAPTIPSSLPPTPTTPRPPAPGGQALALRVFSPLCPLWGEDASAALGGFLSVSAALLLWLGVCQWHLTRLRYTSQLATTGLVITLLAELTTNPPRLLSHPSVHSPFLAGYHRPVIFLPASYGTDFNADALRAIFVHELAHRDRRDNLWTLAARLLTALLWPQPLLWLLVRRLEHINEDACDEAVLAHHCPPRAYADCLLSLASRPPLRHSQRTLNAGVAPFRSSVGRRISRILTTKGDRPMTPITARLRFTAALLTLVAALSGAFLVSSAPAQTTLPPGTAADSTARTGRIEWSQKQLMSAQDKLAIAQTDLATTKTQLTDEMHTALPRADPVTLAKAFNLEGKVGWSLSAAKLFGTWKVLSLKKHHLPSYEKEARYEAEALTRLKQCNLQEAELFPQTAETAQRLPHIHALSEHLYEQKTTVFEDQVEAQALASMLREQNKPHHANAMLEGKPISAGDTQRPDASDPQKRSFLVNFQTPPNGIHTLKVLVEDAAGKRLVSSRSYFSRTQVRLPVTAEGRLVSFQIYDNGKLTKTQQMTDGLAPAAELQANSNKAKRKAQFIEGITKFRDRTQTQLAADQKLLTLYEQSFQEEMRQALPQADAATLTKASNLESGLGGLISSRQFIQQEVTYYVEKHKHYASPSIAKKYAKANQRHLAEIKERQAEIKPLLAEEVRIFPATADSQQHLTQIHNFAIKAHETGLHVMVDTAQLNVINQTIRQH